MKQKEAKKQSENETSKSKETNGKNILKRNEGKTNLKFFRFEGKQKIWQRNEVKRKVQKLKKKQKEKYGEK